MNRHSLKRIVRARKCRVREIKQEINHLLVSFDFRVVTNSSSRRTALHQPVIDYFLTTVFPYPTLKKATQTGSS